MTVPQRHITAGDICPVTIKTESTYGTPTGSHILYGDVAEGGNITFKDTPNPYLSWRYGSRSFDPNNYVIQQRDAAFSAVLEARDKAGWEQIIKYAVSSTGNTTEQRLASRSEYLSVRVRDAIWSLREYNGCKTDKLTISADAPGGIVKFEEDVMAMKSTSSTPTVATAEWTDSSPAVQWMNGITLNNSAIYPQSFKISIANNLERVRVPEPLSAQYAITGALIEGKREIDIEMDMWMDDLNYINGSVINGTVSGDLEITLGLTNKVKITLSDLKYMADGNYTPLVQDKQRQTVRYRAANIAVATVA